MQAKSYGSWLPDCWKWVKLDWYSLFGCQTFWSSSNRSALEGDLEWAKFIRIWQRYWNYNASKKILDKVSWYIGTFKYITTELFFIVCQNVNKQAILLHQIISIQTLMLHSSLYSSQYSPSLLYMMMYDSVHSSLEQLPWVATSDTFVRRPKSTWSHSEFWSAVLAGLHAQPVDLWLFKRAKCGKELLFSIVPDVMATSEILIRFRIAWIFLTASRSP